MVEVMGVMEGSLHLMEVEAVLEAIPVMVALEVQRVHQGQVVEEVAPMMHPLILPQVMVVV
jgi:hypothetical protein